MNKKIPIILGIDEAGRGPVLGSMVYACMGWCEDFNPEDNFLKKLDDSKKKTEKEREELFDRLQQMKLEGIVHYEFEVISPKKISNNMLSVRGNNLNQIAKESTFQLIDRFLIEGFKVKKVFVDTVGPTESYRKCFEERFKNRNISFIVESKADSTYKIVSAASIIAKVVRDKELRLWKFEESKNYNHNFGCGYPGDEITKTWLRNCASWLLGFPTIARESWQTIETLSNEVCCKRSSRTNEILFAKEILRECGVKNHSKNSEIFQIKDFFRSYHNCLGINARFEL